MGKFLSSHHRLTDQRDKRHVVDHPAEHRAPGHAAALGIVVRVDSDDPRNARVAPRGDDERERTADRDACNGNVAKVEFVEKRFNCFGEEGRVIASLRYVGVAVARMVQGIDGKVVGKLGDNLLEQIELRSERVEKNEDGTFARFDVAEF